MSTLLIRRLDDGTKSRLRIRAASKGHSMEQEAREILQQTLAPKSGTEDHLVDRIMRRFQPLGGVDLPQIRRGSIRKPPVLDK